MNAVLHSFCVNNFNYENASLDFGQNLRTRHEQTEAGLLVFTLFSLCFAVNATASFMISCNIFFPLFHCHIIMTVISYKCCSFGIVARKSSPCFKPNAFSDQHSTLSSHLMKIALSKERQN